MTTTSGTHNFKNFENDELILECFERIGFDGEQLTPVQINSAKRSLNLLLLDWITRDINLWTIHTNYLSLHPFQSVYQLKAEVIDILNVNLRQFNRPLNGTANSSSGDANNAFDNNDLTACTQDAPDGYISYGYFSNANSLSTVINFIGIQSNVDRSYSLTFEHSSDNVNWQSLQELPAQSYAKGNAVWFDIIKPISSPYYRIRETGGNILDLQEIYFTNNIIDLRLSAVSRDTYLSFSQKFNVGRPTSYYFDKQIVPELNMWYVPTNQYKVVQYSSVNAIEDAGSFLNSAEVPPKMYPALVAGLTWMIAVKYSPETASELKEYYEEAYSIATANDIENVNYTIDIDVSKYNEN